MEWGNCFAACRSATYAASASLRIFKRSARPARPARSQEYFGRVAQWLRLISRVVLVEKRGQLQPMVI